MTIVGIRPFSCADLGGSRVPSLFSEIRRRRVLRTVTIYLAGAWLLIEVSSTIFPELGMPDWSVRVVIGLMAAGFPVAVVLSWIFDINLDGIRRTDPVAPPPTVAVPADLPEPPERSVAVLPFVNVSGDEQNTYFTDGISEELINRLSRQEGLSVPARTSSFALRDSGLDVRAVAARLGVRHVLEGSVRRDGDRVRITARLVEAARGYQLWASSFDRQIDDIFEVQSGIARAISRALEVALSESDDESPDEAEPPTQNIEAYECFLRGRFLWQKRGALAIQGATRILAQAVELDPTFAEAHAALAGARAVLHEYTAESLDADFHDAHAHAECALQLKPDLAAAHAVIGYMGLRRWDWEQAHESLARATALDDADPLNHQWHSNFLNDVGRLDEALAEAIRAVDLDRLSPMANIILAVNYTLQGDDEMAVKHADVASEFQVGGLVPAYVRFLASLRAGRYDEAVAIRSKSLTLSGKMATWVEPAVAAMADASKLDAGLAALDEAAGRDWITDSALLVQYILLGQADRAFDLAERAVRDKSLEHTWFMLPEAAPMRSHPRFLELAGQVDR